MTEAQAQRPAKRIAAIQSCYIPWRGYFDFIASVDEFVIYDDVQYSKGGFRNRNKIKTAAGTTWLTVPIQHGPLQQRICDVKIDSSKDWRARHRLLFTSAYRHAPHFQDALALLEAGLAENTVFLSDLNVALLRHICAYLWIKTPLRDSRQFELRGASTERLMGLLRALNATTYVSGPSAADYLDLELFRQEAIALQYKSYVYPEYPQEPGPFVGDVTILDLIAHMGPAARDYIRSQAADVPVVPGAGR